jgi:hypothetical protein
MSDVLSRAQQLFELGAHLGHRKNRLHPRSRRDRQRPAVEERGSKPAASRLNIKIRIG